MQNVVGNDKKYKGIWTSQFLLATTIVGWKVVGVLNLKKGANFEKGGAVD